MNIAELFVRVRADVTDVDRRLKAVDGQLVRVGAAAKGTELPMGKMNNALRMLAQRATSTSAPVGSLLATLGTFAVGSTVIAGALIGIAAIAKAYELMTEGSRKAKKATDDLIKSLVDQTKATYNATVAGRDLIKLQAEMELQAAKASSGVGVRTFLGANVIDLLSGSAKLAPADDAARTKRIADATTAVAQATANLAKAYEESLPKVNKVVTATEKAAKVTQEVAFSWRDAFGYAEKLQHTVGKTIEQITLLEAQAMLDPMKGINMNTVNGVDTGAWAKEQEKTRQELAYTSQLNADIIKGAVLQSASIIVSALNIGGGGRSSNLGGALGSTAGFAAGFLMGGPVGGAIGATIGQIGGSLLGGLFDSNKEALNRNTQATRENTAALMLNAPSGYKTAGARFDATEIRTAHQRYLTRGGTPILGAA